VRPPGGSEKFSSEATSVENEMSVIKYMTLCGDAPLVGLSLPEIDKFQVPHHGGRRNLSTEILLVAHASIARCRMARKGSQSLFRRPRKIPTIPVKQCSARCVTRGAFILTTEGKRPRCRNRPGRRLRAGASSWPIQLKPAALGFSHEGRCLE
jgi:hypothetical protein